MAPIIGALLQVVLTGQPQLVSLTAALLHTVLLHDSAAMASLYRTGVFFFALAYCGSNLVELACLLQVISSPCRFLAASAATAVDGHHDSAYA